MKPIFDELGTTDPVLLAYQKAYMEGKRGLKALEAAASAFSRTESDPVGTSDSSIVVGKILHGL